MISAGWKWIESTTDSLWPASLELVVAASALLLIAFVTQIGLRRASASLRHRIWSLTMGALLLQPLLCPILPKLPIPLRVPLAENRPAASSPATLTPEQPTGSAIALPPGKSWKDSAVHPAATNGTDPEVHPTPSVFPAEIPAAALDPRPAAAPTAKASIASGRSLLATCYSVLVLVWAFGTALYLLAMARWLWLERRLARNAGLLDDPSWQTLLEEMKLQLGVRWAVTVGVSRESEVPLTIGWRRPTILLPVDCGCWTADKRRVVLAHELSHVARHDVFWQVVARLACAVYWFHPLAWLAERRMRVERELACDDAVLRSGSEPDQYATVLLDVAAAIRHRPHARAAAIAMACRHPIQRRIRAILQPGLNRLPVGPRTGRLLLGAALLLVVLAAGLHPFAPPPVIADPPNATAGAHLAPRHAPAEAKWEMPGVHSMRFRVVDEAGKPIAGATVRLSCVVWGGRGKTYPPAVKTDGEGVATIELPQQKINLVHAYASADKHASAGADWANNDEDRVRVPAEFTFKLGQLRAGATVTVMHKRSVVDGIVTDPQGKPVAGAAVGQFDGLSGSAFPRTKTDQNGHYRLPPCEAGGYCIAAAAEGYAPDSQWVAVGEGPSTADLRLRKGEMVRIRVVDKQGKPLPDVTVSTFLDNENFYGMHLEFATDEPAKIRQLFLTDADGRWTKLWIPGDIVHFGIAKPGFATVEKKVAAGAPECVVVLEADGSTHPGKAAPPAAASSNSAKVTGKVIDENGKPVSGADVWLPVIFYGVGPGRTLHAKSDAQGRFAIEISAALLSKMQRWDWAMTAWWAYAHGHQVGAARAEKPSDASDVVIRLGPETDTSFIVRDPEGQPCAGALVEPDSIRVINTAGLPDELRARVAARTDADGRVLLPAVSRQTLSAVRITTEEFGVQIQRMLKSGPPAADGGTIHLRPMGKIEGRLIAGPPETGRNVWLFFSTEDRRAKTTEYDANIRKEWLALHPERRSVPWPTEGRAEVKSDTDGRFVVPALAEGDLEIYVAVSENQPLRPRLPEHVRLGSGATTVLEIPLVSTVRVRGSVREQGTAKPLPGTLVFISYGVGHQGASAVSDAQGDYTAQVLPGRVSFQIIAMPRGYAQVGGSWNGDVDFPNDEIDVPKGVKEFDLPPAEVAPTKDIQGRLVDEHDRPVSKVRLWIVGANRHRHYGYGNSDSSGKFTLYDVPTTIDASTANYEWASDTDSNKCEVLKTNPLVLRAMAREQR